MTLATKLNKALTTKTAIKTAIENYGVEVISEKFADYPAYIADIINHIEAGGGIEIVGAVNRQVKLGETLSAGAAIDVVGNVWGSSYKKNPDPDILPTSSASSCAMSADGQLLVVGINSTFVTYKWSEANSRYEKTNDPDFAPFSSSIKACAMSDDGQFLFIVSNTARSYKWSEANSRYEMTAVPSHIPSGDNCFCAMSADGQFLAASNYNSPYLITYKWSEANNRYEKTNNPDLGPYSYTESCAMSADGQLLVVGQRNSYLYTYKWSEANNRYEKTNEPDINPSGGIYACAMSADGQFLAASNYNSPYLYTYKWSEANNRYEKTNNPDFAPSGGTYFCAMSADGTYLLACHAGSVLPARLVTYKWSIENARYERMDSPDVAPPDPFKSRLAISSDGTYCAVSYESTTSPSYLLTYKLNIEGHDLKAYASQNKMWRMNSHYTGVLSETGEAGDIVAAKMLTKTPADPLEVFGPNPGEE